MAGYLVEMMVSKMVEMKVLLTVVDLAELMARKLVHTTVVR